MQDTEHTPEVQADEATVTNTGRRRFARQALLGLAAAAGAAIAVPKTAEAGSSTDSWKMEGNGNVDSSDFIGTTNAKRLVFKTNGQHRMSIAPTGQMVIGDAAASAASATRLDVTAGGSTAIAIHGASNADGTSALGVLGRLLAKNLYYPGYYTAGVMGEVVQPDNVYGIGVLGQHAGDGHGVRAFNSGSKQAALSAGNMGSTGTAPAMDGATASPTGIAIIGRGLGASSTGVRGTGGSVGVNGYSKTGHGLYGAGHNGVYARSETTSGAGVYAVTTSTSSTARALLALMPAGAAGLAAEFRGNVKINGNLTYTGMASKVAATLTTLDHPLDPENQTLTLAEVAAPQMTVVYNGTATLDERGRAEVMLPPYVCAMSGDFSYQLTAVGGSMPHLHIARKLAGDSFAIDGGKAGMEVSWQITGVRADAYARANPVTVEAAKPEAERGTYLAPEAFGLGAERGVDYARNAAVDAEMAADARRVQELDVMMQEAPVE